MRCPENQSRNPFHSKKIYNISFRAAYVWGFSNQKIAQAYNFTENFSILSFNITNFGFYYILEVYDFHCKHIKTYLDINFTFIFWSI